MIPLLLGKCPCWNNPVKAEELAKATVLVNAPSRFGGCVKARISRGFKFAKEGTSVFKRTMKDLLRFPVSDKTAL